MRKYLYSLIFMVVITDALHANQAFLELCKIASPIQIENQVNKEVLVLYRDDKGQNGLMYASMYNKNIDTLKKLITLTKNIDTRDLEGKTALIKAIESGNTFEIIDELLKSGASLQIQCKNGITPLMYSKKNKLNIKVVELLFEYCKDRSGKYCSIIAQKDMSGKNPYHYAVESGNLELVKLIATRDDTSGTLGRIYNINEKDLEGNTPLIYSVINNSIEMSDLLLRLGAFDRRNNEGKNAFDYAYENPLFNQSEVLWKLNDLQYIRRSER